MASDVITNSAMAQALVDLIDETDLDKQIVVTLGFEDHGQATVITIEKLEPPKDQAWFEMPEVRRRSLAKAVWIPVRASKRIISLGKRGHEGFLEEYYGVGSVMFPAEFHDDAIKLDWMDIGISNSYTGGQVTEYLRPGEHSEVKQLFDMRIPFSQTRLHVQLRIPSKEPRENTILHQSGEYRHARDKATGTALVMEQRLTLEQPVWHLHQDFVIGLGLVREGDRWVRPEEGYVDVARLTRDKEGAVQMLEVRGQHLRDYLCARRSNLYLSTYRSRVEICADQQHIDWNPIPYRERSELSRWEGRVLEIHEGGMPYGVTTAVFHVARTDVDDDEDVPSFDFATDDGVESESWTEEHAGRRLYRIEGELWRTEVIEGSGISERVLGQEPPATVEFIVDAAGNKETRDTLQDGSRWLWFGPQIITAILQRRGSFLTWYTKDTGEIGLIPGWGVHFGINKLGLINVYAKDIALLPDWQQRIWAGANLAPDGGVSTELLDSQIRATPASTQAPEGFLKKIYDSVNQAAAEATGMQLFRPHQAADELFLKIHRFRALDRSGLFELAKDIARLTVESIDGRALSVLAPPPTKTKSGSIKHLEAVLASILDGTIARQITRVFVGINELRQADAHMPSSELDNSLNLAGIRELGVSVQEAEQMLRALTDSLSAINSALRSSLTRSAPSG